MQWSSAMLIYNIEVNHFESSWNLNPNSPNFKNQFPLKMKVARFARYFTVQ